MRSRCEAEPLQALLSSVGWSSAWLGWLQPVEAG